MDLFRTKPISELHSEAADSHELNKSLSPLNLVSLGIGAVIGAGIFVITGNAAALYAGPAIVISFIISGLGCLSAGARELRANPLGMPIGCQTYPVRNMIAKDFTGTIKQLAEIGFQTIELCSPVGYADSGFAGLAKYKGAELRRMFGDLGVKCESSHFDIGELRKDFAGRIAWANDLGLTQMMVPSLDGPRNPTMDDVKRAAEEYNKMGEQSAKAGIQQGLHNEGFELSMVGGKRTYDLLLDLLDPKLVKFQFQVSTISRGY